MTHPIRKVGQWKGRLLIMGQFERQYDERIQSLTFRDLTDDVMSDAETCPAIILDTLSLALSSIDNKVDLVVSTPSR